jgi:hypothetical protein
MKKVTKKPSAKKAGGSNKKPIAKKTGGSAKKPVKKQLGGRTTEQEGPRGWPDQGPTAGPGILPGRRGRTETPEILPGGRLLDHTDLKEQIPLWVREGEIDKLNPSRAKKNQPSKKSPQLIMRKKGGTIKKSASSKMQKPKPQTKRKGGCTKK